MKKYLFLAAVSGCAWAVIAYVLSLGAFSSGIVAGGVIASPVIGLFIGLMLLFVRFLPAISMSEMKVIVPKPQKEESAG